MRGKFIGVGVGPGDPELMTVKAINTIKNSDVVAFTRNDVKAASYNSGNDKMSGTNGTSNVAYNIAIQMIPEMAEKILLPVAMPMSADISKIADAHMMAALDIEKHLKEGRNVVFLVLGDVAIYSTFIYLKDIIARSGYDTEIVSGITSFSAAAAVAGIPLCMWDEKLHIIPARHEIPETFEKGENYVLMKAGSRLADITAKAKEAGRDVIMVENCGMPDERVYDGVENIPEKAGYYSLIMIK